jgi:hypothetical protein
LVTRETVAGDTPARRATWAISTPPPFLALFFSEPCVDMTKIPVKRV